MVRTRGSGSSAGKRILEPGTKRGDKVSQTASERKRNRDLLSSHRCIPSKSTDIDHYMFFGGNVVGDNEDDEDNEGGDDEGYNESNNEDNNEGDNDEGYNEGNNEANDADDDNEDEGNDENIQYHEDEGDDENLQYNEGDDIIYDQYVEPEIGGGDFDIEEYVDAQHNNDEDGGEENVGVGEEIVEEENVVVGEEMIEEEIVEEDPCCSKKQSKGIDKKRPDTRKFRGIQNTGPFPGGPYDNRLLRNFYHHTALRTWIGNERVELLKTVNHVKKLWDWKIENEDPMVQSKFEATGLSFLRNAYESVSRLNITAFIERWHPETNTFHMPFGEMTITLEDVEQLTGMKINGELLLGLENWDIDILVRAFGLDKDEIETEMKARKTKGTVRLDWIKRKFAGYTMTGNMDLDERNTDQVVRAYSLYLLGCTLFCDKSGNTISVGWVPYLMEVNEINKYAWGTSGLVYFYRQMGIASRGDNKQIAGLQLLLEAWIYEHFPCLMGIENDKYVPGSPLALKWIPLLGSGDTIPKLKTLRRELDRLDITQVVWDPYHLLRALRRDGLPHGVNFYHGVLCCMDIYEPYHPSRVLRQFSFTQVIPNEPCVPDVEDRPSSGRGYNVFFTKLKPVYYKRWRDESRRIDLRRYRRVNYPWECVDGYLEWFRGQSHPFVHHDQDPQVRHAPPRFSNSSEWIPNIENARTMLGGVIDGDGNKKVKSIMPTLKKVWSLLTACVSNSSTRPTSSDEAAEGRIEHRSKQRHDKKSKRGRKR